MNYIIIIAIVLIIVILTWLMIVYISNPLFAYSLIGWWGKKLDSVKNKQNAECYNDLSSTRYSTNGFGTIPSLMKAEYCPLKSARKLEGLIRKKHDKILKEVNNLLHNYEGVAMTDIDEVQGQWLQGSKNWRTLWVKFLDTWAGTAKYLPTLRNIVEEMGDDITLLHVSILHPGMELSLHKGIHAGVWRYHYGLVIPEGDTALAIDGKIFKWREGEGVIWDDTLLHEAWNHTDKLRIVIFADLPRDLHLVAGYFNKVITRAVQSNKNVKKIAAMLAEQGIKID